MPEGIEQGKVMRGDEVTERDTPSWVVTDSLYYRTSQGCKYSNYKRFYSQPAEAVIRGAGVRLNGLATQTPVHPKDNDTQIRENSFPKKHQISTAVGPF